MTSPEGVKVSVNDTEDLPNDPGTPEQDPEAGGGSENNELIAGKFKTQEDLLKAYKELETKLGTREEQNPDPAPDPAKITPTEEGGTPEGTKGVTLDNALNELSENNEISEETYKALEAQKGLSRSDVDTWAAGVRARSTQLLTDLQATAGGADALKGVLDWASQNASAEEIAAYNEAVDAGNVTAAKMFLRAMRAAYVEAEGKSPNLIGGENVPRNSGSVRPFKSQAAMANAMTDPKYVNDPEYREEVDARVAASEGIF
jgi:hypothetical protein